MIPQFREFTVAVFVVHLGRVLLHYHRKLDLWLPPGGHIEPNELPDEAAVREVGEETGVRIELFGGLALSIDYPRQLAVPAGIQLEDIPPDHQHIDLVYFGRPLPGAEGISPELAERDRVGWYEPSTLADLGVNAEVRAWVEKAITTVEG